MREVDVRWTVATALLAGCMTEADFPDAVADEVCRREQQCDPDRLVAIYGTDDACRDAVQDQMELFLVQAEQLECDWSRDRARDCLEAIEAPSCDELSVVSLLDGCAAAWGCAD